MKPTKRYDITLFIILILLLFLSLFFKSNITGFTAFSVKVLDNPVYDYWIIALALAIILSILAIYKRGRIKEEIEHELDSYGVRNPNSSFSSLEKYIDYCISQGRDKTETKEILTGVGWNENLINEAFEDLKAKT